MAIKKKQQAAIHENTATGPATGVTGSPDNGLDDEIVPDPGDIIDVADGESALGSDSDVTSLVSGSSVWTDNTNPDRSSRRALILQMAKARMKSNKTGDGSVVDGNEAASKASLRPMDRGLEEEKKLESQENIAAADIDLTEDLD